MKGGGGTKKKKKKKTIEKRNQLVISLTGPPTQLPSPGAELAPEAMGGGGGGGGFRLKIVNNTVQ